MRAGGKIFDWHVLSRMNYYAVHHNSEMSNLFKDTIGILIGDVGLPILWNLFLVDFVLHPDRDEVIMARLIITSLEQTDGIIILILETPERLQRKMNALWKWCNRNHGHH